MRKYYCVLPCALLPLVLVSCQSVSRSTGPAPEAEQVIGDGLKDLYMRASAAAPQSPQQQKLVLKMANQASNGKELMLVMRAAVGVFPSEDAAAGFRSTVTEKMMRLATLDQMADFVTQYSIDAARARPFVQRMMQLAGDGMDPRSWRRIRAAAGRLKLSDLERQAQMRAAQQAGE